MNKRTTYLIAPSLVITLYVVLTVPFALWPHAFNWTAAFGLGIYSFLALGLAVELTEAALALIWRPIRVDQAPCADRRGRVAVLMTVRNDSDAQALRGLVPLAQAGYRVFVLDDSDVALAPPKERLGTVNLVRRASRHGAKAGNLNHWLSRFGDGFEYALVLDADSVISSRAADDLLRAADHPANALVVVFQSKILPRRPRGGSWLQHVLGSGARIRARIHARVHARLGVLLSFGHNQLLRLSGVRALGGFDEKRSAEDTVLSLGLAARGYGICLVDTWSWDTDPATMAQYVRRTTRWARQTVEIFRDDWRTVPLRMKLILCWHLLSYALPVLATALLLLSVFNEPGDPWLVRQFSLRALRFEAGYKPYGLAMWPGIAAVLLRIVLHLLLAWRERVRLRTWLLAALAGGAIQALLVFPLVAGMLASAMGRSTSFEPTNAPSARPAKSLLGLSVVGALALFAGMGIAVAFHPGGLWLGCNWLWCGGLLAVPLILIRMFVDRRRNYPQSG
jgi:cellulose synthase/poly-beta-1,6-N-acetylglucosamine synthase-like glycosyltransferase